MNLIISFSARSTGNCGRIAEYIRAPGDKLVHFKDMHSHSCSNCDYECFHGVCKYREDDIYSLFDSMQGYDKIILIIPMYCGNPSSLYFIFNERSQDYFSHNSDTYKDIEQKLYIIGVYGSQTETPHFLSHFKMWFETQSPDEHILGVERRVFQQKMKDCILDIEVIRNRISAFIK